MWYNIDVKNEREVEKMKKLYKVTYYNLEKNDYELTTVSANCKRYAREIAEDMANKEQLVESVEEVKSVDFKFNFKK